MTTFQSECGICHESKKDSLTFPCCNNSFTICKNCLLKHPKKCPKCFSPFELQVKPAEKFITFEWKQALAFLFILGYLVITIYTFILLINRTYKCEDQPCYNGVINEKCLCTMAALDVAFFVILNAFFSGGLFVMMYTGKLKEKRDYLQVDHPFYLIISSVFMSSLPVVYFFVENKYKEPNIMFIHSITFIIVLYIAIPIIMGFFYFLFRKVIPSICSICFKTHNTYETVSIVVNPI